MVKYTESKETFFCPFCEEWKPKNSKKTHTNRCKLKRPCPHGCLKMLEPRYWNDHMTRTCPVLYGTVRSKRRVYKLKDRLRYAREYRIWISEGRSVKLFKKKVGLDNKQLELCLADETQCFGMCFRLFLFN